MLKINHFHRCRVCNFANRQRRRSTPKPKIMIRPDMDNILALTETEFFKKLRKGLHDENLHVDLRDFIVRFTKLPTLHRPTVSMLWKRSSSPTSS